MDADARAAREAVGVLGRVRPPEFPTLRQQGEAEAQGGVWPSGLNPGRRAPGRPRSSPTFSTAALTTRPCPRRDSPQGRPAGTNFFFLVFQRADEAAQMSAERLRAVSRLVAISAGSSCPQPDNGRELTFAADAQLKLKG